MASNIHRLSDLEGRGDGRYGGGGGGGGMSVAQLPRQKCIDVFLPGFKFASFIFAVSIVQVLVYIASVFVGSQRLRPDTKTLLLFGSAYGACVAQGEVWRLFLPIFLHVSIWHLFMNVFMQLSMGFRLEDKFGTGPFVALYLCSGVCGNLLSVAWAPCKISAGASTSGYGLIGVQVGHSVVK
eukprot:GHVU01139032.1.p1 GENE.GHVU01139032.1~~GHVU01139032.1.p1  ORF type:complete len:182 (-),score=31.14 GHVU01139032.1:248-793(-)